MADENFTRDQNARIRTGRSDIKRRINQLWSNQSSPKARYLFISGMASFKIKDGDLN